MMLISLLESEFRITTLTKSNFSFEVIATELFKIEIDIGQIRRV